MTFLWYFISLYICYIFWRFPFQITNLVFSLIYYIIQLILLNFLFHRLCFENIDLCSCSQITFHIWVLFYECNILLISLRILNYNFKNWSYWFLELCLILLWLSGPFYDFSIPQISRRSGQKDVSSQDTLESQKRGACRVWEPYVFTKK